MLTFDGSGLNKIESLEQKRELGYLRLEPKLMGMLEKIRRSSDSFYVAINSPKCWLMHS